MLIDNSSTCLHYDTRPKGVIVDTLVIHSMYAPEAPTPYDPQACLEALNKYKVSAHFLIDKLGNTQKILAPYLRAWHAGPSAMPDGRNAANDFSIGVELINDEKSLFTSQQYQSLALLTVQLLNEFPLQWITGHEHIAHPPGRKKDPGALFDWRQLENKVSKLNPQVQLTLLPLLKIPLKTSV